MNGSAKGWGHATALLTVLIWGTTFASTKVLLATWTPLEILAMRFAIGLVCLTMIRPRWMAWNGWKREGLMACAGVCGVTLYFLLENVALTYSQASNVGVIVSVTPFITALLAHVFLKGERLTRRFAFGFALSIGGIALMMLNGRYVLHLNPLGDTLALLAACAWAVYSVLMKKAARPGGSVVKTTQRVFVYGLLAMIPCFFFLEADPSFLAKGDATSWCHILYLGAMASAVCFAAWNRVVKQLGAASASVYIYLVPVIAVVSSALALHERLTPMAIAGTGLTLLGVVVSELSSHFRLHARLRKRRSKIREAGNEPGSAE